MAKYLVTLPVGGHIHVEVEAESANAAIEAAMLMDFRNSDIEEWDVLEKVSRGNVLYFPQPSSADARKIEE